MARPRGRLGYLSRLVELVSPKEISIVDPLDGWPSLAKLHTSAGDIPVSIHIGYIYGSHRGREMERRFQNPERRNPVRSIDNAFPLLLGLWESGARPVVVGMDAQIRIEKSTRQSMFVPLLVLEQAAEVGWAQHYNSKGELIIGFHPSLLRTYFEMRKASLTSLPEEISQLVDASGVTVDPVGGARDRARRSSLALVRRAKFARDIVEAYGGLCAVCDLNLGLVEGAHIYPVQAPKSVDAVWNGVALCSNHHNAFDRHFLWVAPDSREIQIHPDILNRANGSEASRNFIMLTRPFLRPPLATKDEPRSEMFVNRYNFFQKQYSWASKRRRIKASVKNTI